MHILALFEFELLHTDSCGNIRQTPIRGGGGRGGADQWYLCASERHRLHNGIHDRQDVKSQRARHQIVHQGPKQVREQLSGVFTNSQTAAEAPGGKNRLICNPFLTQPQSSAGIITHLHQSGGECAALRHTGGKPSVCVCALHLRKLIHRLSTNAEIFITPRT